MSLVTPLLLGHCDYSLERMLRKPLAPRGEAGLRRLSVRKEGSRAADCAGGGPRPVISNAAILWCQGVGIPLQLEPALPCRLCPPTKHLWETQPRTLNEYLTELLGQGIELAGHRGSFRLTANASDSLVSRRRSRSDRELRWPVAIPAPRERKRQRPNRRQPAEAADATEAAARSKGRAKVRGSGPARGFTDLIELIRPFPPGGGGPPPKKKKRAGPAENRGGGGGPHATASFPGCHRRCQELEGQPALRHRLGPAHRRATPGATGATPAPNQQARHWRSDLSRHQVFAAGMQPLPSCSRGMGCLARCGSPRYKQQRRRAAGQGRPAPSRRWVSKSCVGATSKGLT